MIEWLRNAGADPTIELAGKTLPIELKRMARAKRLTLRLASDGSAVQITMPRWCSTKEAVDFALLRQEWLETQLAKVPTAENVLERGTLRYRGHELAIDWQERARRKPVLSAHDASAKEFDKRIVVGGPRDTVTHRLQRWLEGEAQSLLEADLAFFTAAAGLKTPPLRLSRAKRRWGSCSSKGVVRINWRLIQAPDAVRRSVVAHETAHLVHFDHSPAFHGLLAELYAQDDGADIAEADSWLKHNGRTLYADFG